MRSGGEGAALEPRTVCGTAQRLGIVGSGIQWLINPVSLVSISPAPLASRSVGMFSE